MLSQTHSAETDRTHLGEGTSYDNRDVIARARTRLIPGSRDPGPKAEAIVHACSIFIGGSNGNIDRVFG